MVPLTRWLNTVINDLQIHTREGWGMVLGCSPETIGYWIERSIVPDPSRLRNLVLLLKERYPERAKEAIVMWDEISIRPMLEVCLSTEVSIGYHSRTLGRYILGPLKQDVELALSALPPIQQEAFLFDLLRRIQGER